VPQAFRLNTLKRFNQPMWRDGNKGRIDTTHKGDPLVRFSLVANAWLGSVALLLEIWDTRLLPNVHSRSWRLVKVYSEQDQIT
jgi:hypothetical protein